MVTMTAMMTAATMPVFSLIAPTSRLLATQTSPPLVGTGLARAGPPDPAGGMGYRAERLPPSTPGVKPDRLVT